MNETAKAWAKNVDCNVCVVDWRPLSGKSFDVKDVLDAITHLNYVKVAMEYTVLTKNSIHRFMEFLKDQGMKIDQVSIAGHR